MTDREINLEHEKIHAEISKLIAETAKINAENRWYPFLLGSGVMLAGVAAAKLLRELDRRRFSWCVQARNLRLLLF